MPPLTRDQLWTWLIRRNPTDRDLLPHWVAWVEHGCPWSVHRTRTLLPPPQVIHNAQNHHLHSHASHDRPHTGTEPSI